MFGALPEISPRIWSVKKQPTDNANRQVVDWNYKHRPVIGCCWLLGKLELPTWKQFTTAGHSPRGRPFSVKINRHLPDAIKYAFDTLIFINALDCYGQYSGGDAGMWNSKSEFTNRGSGIMVRESASDRERPRRSRRSDGTLARWFFILLFSIWFCVLLYIRPNRWILLFVGDLRLLVMAVIKLVGQ